MARKTERELIEAAMRRNAEHAKEGKTYRILPLRPTLAMMEAAIDAPDVFREGDRASDWLLPLDKLATPDERYLDEGLVSRFGPQRAFALSLAADVWEGCIAGLREWIDVRGRGGGGTDWGDGWFKPVPRSFPKGGWPMRKEEVTPEHETHAKCGETPIRIESRCFHLNGIEDLFDVLPIDAAAIMAMRGAQANLSSIQYLNVEDSVDWKTMPFIPGWESHGSYVDEERHHLLAGAMWAAAARAFDGGSGYEPMPSHPATQAIRMTRLVLDEVPHGIVAYPDRPFASVGIESGAGRFSCRYEGGSVAWEADTGTRRMSEGGLVLYGRRGESRMMRKFLHDVAYGEGAKAEFTLS